MNLSEYLAGQIILHIEPLGALCVVEVKRAAAALFAEEDLSDAVAERDTAYQLEDILPSGLWALVESDRSYQYRRQIPLFGKRGADPCVIDTERVLLQSPCANNL